MTISTYAQKEVDSQTAVIAGIAIQNPADKQVHFAAMYPAYTTWRHPKSIVLHVGVEVFGSSIPVSEEL